MVRLGQGRPHLDLVSESEDVMLNVDKLVLIYCSFVCFSMEQQP